MKNLKDVTTQKNYGVCCCLIYDNKAMVKIYKNMKRLLLILRDDLRYIDRWREDEGSS